MSGPHSANHWSFLRFSSVPRHSCHICHSLPPTGKALFSTDIGTFRRSYQCCSRSSQLAGSVCNFWSAAAAAETLSLSLVWLHPPELSGHQLCVGVTLTFVFTCSLVFSSRSTATVEWVRTAGFKDILTGYTLSLCKSYTDVFVFKTLNYIFVILLFY